MWYMTMLDDPHHYCHPVWGPWEEVELVNAPKDTERVDNEDEM